MFSCAAGSFHASVPGLAELRTGIDELLRGMLGARPHRRESPGAVCRSWGTMPGMNTEQSDTAPRVSPSTTSGEREALEQWLDFHRATLARKCEGLDDARLRTPPSRPRTSTCSASSGTWPRSSAAGSATPWPARTPLDLLDGGGPRPGHPHRGGGHLRGGPRHLAGRDRPRPRPGRDPRPRRPGRRQAPERGEVQPPLDLPPHDRGVRPPQRPRGPDPGADRRRDRRLRRPGRRAAGRVKGGRAPAHPCGAFPAGRGAKIAAGAAEWRGCMEPEPQRRSC